MPTRANWIGNRSPAGAVESALGDTAWPERLAYRIAGGAMLVQSLVLGFLAIPVAALLLWPIPSDGEQPRNPALGLPFLTLYLIAVAVLGITSLALLGAGAPGASSQRRLIGTAAGGVAALEVLFAPAWLRLWGVDTVVGWAGAVAAPLMAAACLCFALRLLGPDLRHAREHRSP